MGARITPLVAVAAIAALTACGGGAERRPAEVREEPQPPGWHRAQTGHAAVPLSRPVPEARPVDGAPPERPGLFETPRGQDSPADPGDTTGVLLARRYDPVAGQALIDRYWLYLPVGIESRDDWPLILWLHGRSLRGSDLSLVTRYGLPARLGGDPDFPFVVVAPQLPDGQSWTDTERLAALVRDVADRYPVDDDRVYVVGYSMGAGGVWRLVADHPELFAAVAPAAAYTPAPSAGISAALEDVPVRIDHGTADEAAPFERARAMVAALEAAGVDVTFVVHRGASHGQLTHIYRDDGLFAWLLRHERE